MKQKPCILIADDDFSSRQITGAILAKQGYELIQKSNGQEALACLEDHDIDVVLLDVMMPGMTGFEVCRRLKADERTCRIPVILLTALDGQDHLLEGLEAGADEFLSKPVHALELNARVRTMLRIKRQLDELADNLRFRDELADLIVHDMRNPLSVILGYSQMLLARPDTLGGAQVEERLRIIQSQAQALHSFSNELLMVSKLENDMLLINPEAVDLSLMIERSVVTHEPLAQAKGIAIEMVRPMGDPRLITLDAHLFQRVIENLLSNAIKFSPYGSRVRLGVEYFASGLPRARIRVADEGIGVSETCRQRIFEKYEIVSLKKRGVSQVGLGLYFCRLVAEAHGGRIQVEPNTPKGSVFTVEI